MRSSRLPFGCSLGRNGSSVTDILWQRPPKEATGVFFLSGAPVSKRRIFVIAITARAPRRPAEVCIALAHETKGLDTRAASLAFAYEFGTVAKRLERDERKLMVRAASDGMQKHGV
jgi:hypothetical protein